MHGLCLHLSVWSRVLQTGAMMIALGQGIAGAFTPSDALAEKLKAASSHAGAR
jgi:leucyl aminopeptidase